MQPAQCMLLFLVLAGNSALSRFLRSYTLLYSSHPFLCTLATFMLIRKVSLVHKTRNDKFYRRMHAVADEKLIITELGPNQRRLDMVELCLLGH